MICEAHGWKQKKLPCPWIRCPKGSRGLWTVLGKERTVYVRKRIKDEHGPRYVWEKTFLDADELLGAEDEEEDEIVF